MHTLLTLSVFQAFILSQANYWALLAVIVQWSKCSTQLQWQWVPSVNGLKKNCVLLNSLARSMSLTYWYVLPFPSAEFTNMAVRFPLPFTNASVVDAGENLVLQVHHLWESLTRKGWGHPPDYPTYFLLHVKGIMRAATWHMPQIDTCDFSHTADVEGFSLACGKLEPWAEIRVWKIAGIDLCDASRHHMCDPLDKATICGAVGELVCMSTTAVFTKLFKVSLALWQAVARWHTMITVLLWMLPSISLKNYLKR